VISVNKPKLSAKSSSFEQAAREQAESANRLKDEFLAVVSMSCVLP
jgi:hypothetical protein